MGRAESVQVPPVRADVDVRPTRTAASVQPAADRLPVRGHRCRSEDDVTNDIEDKESFHSADALRYIVSYLRRASVDFFINIQ